MKKSSWGEGVRTMKTSIEIPEELWTAAKIRAVREKANLQDVIADALRKYLKLDQTKKGGKQE
jgi:hypothetical protein